jgi:hypothetical protein
MGAAYTLADPRSDATTAKRGTVGRLSSDRICVAPVADHRHVYAAPTEWTSRRERPMRVREHPAAAQDEFHNPYQAPSSRIGGGDVEVGDPVERLTIARVQRSRRFRTWLLAFATSLQLPVILTTQWLVLSLPAAVVLICVSAALEGQAAFLASTIAGGAKPSWSAALLRGLVVLFGGAMSASGAAVGASIVATYLGNGYTRGRQLRTRGRVLLPPVAEGDDWAREGAALTVPTELRLALAARWRHNGQTEHASVGAFAKLTLDLMALGAPPSLLDAASRDARDEIRHAEACFALARALDGKIESPAAFPGASMAGRGERDRFRDQRDALRRLAVDSLFDGALHEGLSARILAKLARRCVVPEIAGVLRALAAADGRHAAHGWDVVRFCVDRGGDDTLDALAGALETIPEGMATDLPLAARDGSWERFGVHGEALEAAEYAAALRDLRARVSRLARRSRSGSRSGTGSTTGAGRLELTA